MRNNYLIPANSKKSQLILNAFRPIDLGIMGAGALLLVVPIPFCHNVLVFLREVYIYFSSQKTYVWRGWCAKYGFEDDDNKKN